MTSKVLIVAIKPGKIWLPSTSPTSFHSFFLIHANILASLPVFLACCQTYMLNPQGLCAYFPIYLELPLIINITLLHIIYSCTISFHFGFLSVTSPGMSRITYKSTFLIILHPLPYFLLYGSWYIFTYLCLYFCFPKCNHHESSSASFMATISVLTTVQSIWKVLSPLWNVQMDFTIILIKKENGVIPSY